MQSCSVKIKSKLQVSYCYSSGLLLGASIARDNDTNFLTDQKSNESSRLFIRQFAVLCLFTLGSLGILYWNISSKISTLKTSYNASKRQMVRTIEDTMGMQLQSKKSPKTIVTSVQDTFQKEKDLWFSLSQQSFLEYLKKLSKIDRVNLGLELTRVQMTYDTITLEGSVNDTGSKTSWENLTTLQEAIGVVQMFTIVEKPTQPNNFSMKIKISREEES